MSFLGNAFNKLGQIYRESDWMKEVFGVGVDDTTGLPLAMGTAEGTFLGLSFGTWFMVALVIFVIALIATFVAVTYTSCGVPVPTGQVGGPPVIEPAPPPASPVIQPAMPPGTPIIVPAVPTEDTEQQSDQMNNNIDLLNNSPGCEDCSLNLWEAELQKERLKVLTANNMTLYNQLIEQDLEIYRQHGIDPCNSSYFKEGCQH